MKINDVIHAKSKQTVVTIAPDATVRELIALLATTANGSPGS